MEIYLSIAAVVIALISASIVFYACRTSDKNARYTYLANKWYDIKQMEFEYPDFKDPNKTKSYKTSFTGDSLKKYETFAWTCWAHAEDVYDNKFHKKSTFKPTLKWYKDLHYSWLQNNNNKRWMTDFLNYIDKL